MRFFRVGLLAVAAGSITIAVCGACRGGGRVELASLSTKSIDPPQALTGKLRLGECRWWTDGEGRVWFAAQRHIGSILGPRWAFNFQLSLVVEKLPAGSARNYKIRGNGLRAVMQAGPLKRRLVSINGILALYRESQDRMRGSLRVQVSAQSLSLVTGWSKPSRQLFMSEFTAVRDDRGAPQIVEATEADGFERKSLPTVEEETKTERIDSVSVK
jgi:hypothetical protein